MLTLKTFQREQTLSVKMKRESLMKKSLDVMQLVLISSFLYGLKSVMLNLNSNDFSYFKNSDARLRTLSLARVNISLKFLYLPLKRNFINFLKMFLDGAQQV